MQICSNDFRGGPKRLYLISQRNLETSLA